MRTGLQRALFTAAIVALGVAGIVGAAAAGAASAPASPFETGPLAQPIVPAPESVENGPPSPKRFSAVGVVARVAGYPPASTEARPPGLSTPPFRLAVRLEGHERPVLVAILPMTALRVNRKPATVEDLHVGDKIVVVGRPGARGNVIFARGVHVTRPADSAAKLSDLSPNPSPARGGVPSA